MMKPRTFWGALGVVLLLANSTLAQGGDLPLCVKFQWAQFYLVLGRISAVSDLPPDGSGRSAKTSAENAEEKESYLVAPSVSGVSARYEWQSREQRVVIDLQNGNEVTITRQPAGAGGSGSLVFRQPAVGPVELKLTGGPGEDLLLRGETIWHLYLAQPERCRKDLFPLLGRLPKIGDLSETGRELESGLLTRSEAAGQSQRSQLAALVVQLGADKFSQREEAETRLQQYGLVSLAYLRSLDLESLSPEQRLRVRRVIGRLAPSASDSAQRMVRLLCEDASIWLVLLTRDSQDVRTKAAARLAQITGQKIEFDPAGSPDVRKEQVERITKQISR